MRPERLVQDFSESYVGLYMVMQVMELHCPVLYEVSNFHFIIVISNKAPEEPASANMAGR